MPKIAFYSSDSGNHRFIQPIIDKLVEKGYTCQLYNNWHIDHEADILWFDFCDQNLISASKENADFLKTKKVIARFHAVEYYMGFQHAIDWRCVDHVIFVSDHMKRMTMDTCNSWKDWGVTMKEHPQIHVIHNGIDLDKLKFKEHQNGLTIGYAGNIVPAKGMIEIYHFLRELRRHGDYKLKMIGLDRIGGRDREYIDHIRKDLPVEQSEEVSDINAWLDGIDYLWQPSHAESFSLIVGEAMAKGIKPVINNFYGSEELWPKENVYNDFTSFLDIIKSEYKSSEYRNFVERYSLDNEMEKICQLL